MNPKIIDRIRKILARTTERGATEAEAAAAIQAARRLMAEHGVSAVDLESEGFDSLEWTHQPAWEVDGLGDRETKYVAPVVSLAFKVRMYQEYIRDGGSIRTETRVFGEPVNVEVACWAFRYLHGVFKDLWTAYRLATRCHGAKRGAYYYGLALGLQSKLEAADRDESPRSSSGTGLVLAYQAKLNEAFDAMLGPTAKKTRVPKFSDRNVALDGKRDGTEINLSRPIGERESRALTKK